MKETTKMPDSGQFVAVWESGSKLWTDTLLWEDSILRSHVSYGNFAREESPDFYEDMDARYFIAGDNKD